MIGKEKLGFDPTDADTRDASDIVGARLLTDDGTSPISSGDGSSDNVANGFEGIDTRSFGFAWDSVGDNWDRLQIIDGKLKVDAEFNADFDYVYDEDSAHASTDPGAFGLSILISDLSADNSALLAGTNGDYQGFFTNPKGEHYTIDEDANASLDAIEADTAAMAIDLAAIEAEQLAQGITLDSIDTKLTTIDDNLTDGIDVRLEDGAGNDINSYNGCLNVADISNNALLSTAKSVGLTGVILAAEQANRKYLWFQNVGNKNVFIGASGVSSANGLRMSPGAVAEFRFGASISLHAVSASGSQDCRILEAN